MRLGDALLSKKLLSEKDLHKALNAQLIFGAHLGTCLLELGYIDEDRLGQVLSELLGVGYATRAMLEDIPPHVINALPAGVAERRLAVPFEMKGRQLQVAMVDPLSLPTLDELAFVTGCRIRPWVSPEVRLFQALERYYDLPRRQRYVTLARQLDGAPGRARGKATMAAAIGSRAAVRPRAGSEAGAIMPSPEAPVDARESAAPAQPAEAAWLSVAAEQFCRADDVDRLWRITLHAAGHVAPRCALFTVEGTACSVWGAQGFSFPAGRFSVSEEPLFTLPQGDPVYLGPVPPEPAFLRFFERAGLSLPRRIAVGPVHIKDRLTALFYADSGDGSAIDAGPQDLARLLRKLSLAMGMLILKKQIRTA